MSSRVNPTFSLRSNLILRSGLVLGSGLDLGSTVKARYKMSDRISLETVNDQDEAERPRKKYWGEED